MYYHKKLLLIIVGLLVSSISGCNNDSGYNTNFYKSSIEAKDLDIVKKDEFTINDKSYRIGALKPFFTVEGDTLLFFDKMKKKFLYVNDNGDLLSVIGGEGRGPKEFLSVNHFTLDEDRNIVAFDGSQAAIKIMSEENKIIKSFSPNLKKGFFPVGHSMDAKGGKIYLGIINPSLVQENWKCKLIAVYNYKGEYVKTIGKYDPILKKFDVLSNRPSFDINFNNQKVVAVNQSSYRLQVLNKNNGDRTSYFGRKPNYFKVSNQTVTPSMSKKKKQEISTKRSFSNGAFFTDRYYLHFFMNLTQEWFQTLDISNRKYYVTVYSRSSNNLIDTVELPHSLGAVSDNNLYLVENTNPDNFTVGVYEIE